MAREMITPKVGEKVYVMRENGEWYWAVARKKYWKNNSLFYSVSAG